MSEQATQLVEDAFGRIASNVSMLVDREIGIRDVSVENSTARPVGEEVVHISFKLRFQYPDGEERWGCVLLPLPDARSLALYLMMFSEDQVGEQRTLDDLDAATKDALIELGNFFGAAVDEAVKVEFPDVSVRSAGCQGVRSDVRPAFPHEEGDELLVASAQAQVHEWPEFRLLAAFPPLSAA